ncbi:MAG: PA4780 family RIO1-like protein kinase [Pseudomonadota bacterium]|nr:PA4780 family RIO1-like protein kinase [Pseudomonadota bacterium]
MKIPDRLLPLLEQGLIHEVVRPLMSGKEAAVYIVHNGDRYCVAKVYKDADHRSFRQRTAYTEGRQVRNSRQRRAMEKGSKFGKEQQEAAWQTAEVDALGKLGAVGVRVPKVYAYSENVLLMEIMLDPEGQPAPRLCDCDFTPDQAWNTHQFVVRQVVKMLCAGLIHGDLSEYNVLLAADGPVIIDLPQAIDAAHNQQARALLIRDVDNLTAFLARFAPDLAETRFGQEIWGLYERAQLTPDSVLTGRWRGSNRRADTNAVMREIEAAAREARMRRG